MPKLTAPLLWLAGTGLVAVGYMVHLFSAAAYHDWLPQQVNSVIIGGICVASTSAIVAEQNGRRDRRRREEEEVRDAARQAATDHRDGRLYAQIAGVAGRLDSVQGQICSWWQAPTQPLHVIGTAAVPEAQRTTKPKRNRRRTTRRRASPPPPGSGANAKPDDLDLDWKSYVAGLQDGSDPVA